MGAAGVYGLGRIEVGEGETLADALLSFSSCSGYGFLSVVV